MVNHRKVRGMRTQAVCAELWRRLFPMVTDAGSGRSGADLLNTPGYSVEIKARANFDPMAWISQAKRAKKHRSDIPVVVVRCNGQGEAQGGADWPVLIMQGDLLELIEKAMVYDYAKKESDSIRRSDGKSDAAN